MHSDPYARLAEAYGDDIAEMVMRDESDAGHGELSVPTAVAPIVLAWIDQAARAGLSLDPADFAVIDGRWTVDGMHPGEWINALTMD